MALATRCAVATAAFRSSTFASNKVAACCLVATRQWTRFKGLKAMNVSVRSSSWIFPDGSCQSQILQNTQSPMDAISDLGPSHLDRPAVGIRRAPVLDPHDRVVEALGQRPDLAAVDDHAFALV